MEAMALWEPGCVSNISLEDSDWHACQESDCQPRSWKEVPARRSCSRYPSEALYLLAWCFQSESKWATVLGCDTSSCILDIDVMSNLFSREGRVWAIILCKVGNHQVLSMLAKPCRSSSTVQILNWCVCWVFWSVCNREVRGSWRHTGRVHMVDYKCLYLPGQTGCMAKSLKWVLQRFLPRCFPTLFHLLLSSSSHQAYSTPQFKCSSITHG